MERELADMHIGPLDDDEDGRFLEENDPRRIEAEARRGKRFVEDEHHVGDRLKRLGDKIEGAAFDREGD